MKGPAAAGFRLVPCDGEAHSNPFIDNCMRCAPRWGEVEIPEQYATLEEFLAYKQAAELACVSWGNDNDPSAGLLSLASDGSLLVTPGDDYYSGRVSADDALALARAILRKHEGGQP